MSIGNPGGCLPGEEDSPETTINGSHGPPWLRLALSPDRAPVPWPAVRKSICTTCSGPKHRGHTPGDVTPLFSLRENAIAKEPGLSYPERWRCVS